MFGGGELVDKASLLQSQHYKEALKRQTRSMSGAFGLYRRRSIGLRLGRQHLVAVAVILRLRRALRLLLAQSLPQLRRDSKRR